MEEEMPKLSLILNNMQKTKNIRTYLDSASAFGAENVLVVGLKNHAQDIVAHAAKIGMPIQFFGSLVECQAYCKEKGVTICGVEILHQASSITQEPSPFHGSTAFLLGNEGSGMNESQIAICDMFVYIPQYGAGTASLNVTVAASIIMHHFAVWAKTPRREIKDNTFVS